MNQYSQERTQNGKGPIGPGTTQIRGFRGMPRPGDVQSVTQQPVVQQQVSPQTQPEVKFQPTSQVQSQQQSFVGTQPQVEVQKTQAMPGQEQPPVRSTPQVTPIKKVQTQPQTVAQTPKQVQQVTQSQPKVQPPILEQKSSQPQVVLGKEQVSLRQAQSVPLQTILGQEQPPAQQRAPSGQVQPQTQTAPQTQRTPQVQNPPYNNQKPQALPGQEQPPQRTLPQAQPLRNQQTQSATAAYARGLSQAPEQVVEKKARPVVRTFKSDATSYIKEENITDTQIALAEQKRRIAESAGVPIEAPTSRKIWVIVFTILFLLIGIIASVFVFFKPDLSFLGISQNTKAPVIQAPLESLTGSQNTQYLPLDTALSYAEIDLFFDRLLRTENASYLFVEETFDGRKEIIFPNTFFEYTRMYDLQDISFAFRSLEYGAQSGSPYLLLEASDFPKVYPRIFTWEEQLVRQVEPLFPDLRQREIVTTIPVEPTREVPAENSAEGEANTENSTSEEILLDDEESEALITDDNLEIDPVPQEKIITETIDYRGIPFRDALFENQSIRIILDENGQSILYHTFINDRYVLISQDLDIIPPMLEALK